jgi:tetratricopeptide (TPR) repeat protein
MRKWLGLWAAAAAAASLAASAAGAAPKAGASGLPRTLRALGEAADKQDCKTIARLGGPLLDRQLDSLPSDMVPRFYDLVVACEAATGATVRAYAHALKGTALEQSTDILWALRLVLEIQAKNYPAAVVTVETMAQGRGAALNAIETSGMWQFDQSLKEAGMTAQRRRLLKVLASDSYLPDDLYGPDDDFKLAYANLLVDSGDTAAARPVVAGLHDVRILVTAILDPRLRGLLAPGLDIRAAGEAELATHREAAARHPDKLGPILFVAADLGRLGRAQEALQMLQGIASKVDDPAAFTDRDKRLNWYWNAVAGTESMLGHYDQAVAAFGKAVALGESGAPNVSQVINLAQMQNRFGRAADALKTLAVFADPKRQSSPYGEMQLRYARSCANHLAGRDADTAADLAYLKAHEKDAGSALGDALICLGDMDAAAAALIRRLDDPERRAGALLDLSDFDDPPVALPPGPGGDRVEALLARADVKAAIDRAGGTRRFHIVRVEM